MLVQDNSDLTRTLAAVAMGKEPTDLLIQNGRWVCVQTGEIIPKTDIAIKSGRIAWVGPDAAHTIGETTNLVAAEDRFLVPGLLDGHMHVESGMLTVTEFVRAVLPHGTTGMFIDPHEIANIFGLKGVRLMVDEAAVQPIHVWVQVPSCVPSAPGLETPGASLGAAEVAEALSWEGVIGLGEVMNYPGVACGDEKMHAEIGAARRAGKVIGGHYAATDLGRTFHAYAAGGPEDDHEGTRQEDAVARARQGMKVMMRMGSAWHDVAAQVRAVTEAGMDSRHFILCTDDSHSQTLVEEGHVNRAVKEAIAQGVSPVTAIQMATLNPAEHFGVARQVGMIAPGRYADLLLVSDLSSLRIDQVFAKGKLAVDRGDLQIQPPSFSFPEWAIRSVHLRDSLTPENFRLPAPEGAQARSSVVAHVIGIIENQAPTRHLRLEVRVQDGEVKADLRQDIAKIALVERHQGSGKVKLGLVQGFGLDQNCAIATTVAHDSHHMLILGTSETDMAQAGNQLAQVGGGQVVVQGGQILGQVELPIAGLMSAEPAKTVARKAASVLEGFRQCGCSINNPNMQLSLLALVVIPELRISDLGLIDVDQFQRIDLFEQP